MNCIVIDYDQAKLEGSPKAIPTGQSGFSKIKFKFSEEWAGMMKIAQFAQEKSRYNVSVENDGCYCPTELTKGWVFVRVRGYSESSTIATANEIKLPVVNGFVPGGSPSVPPELDLYQKLIEETKSQIGNLDELETEDKSSLVGAVNEIKKKAGAGYDAVKYTEQTLTSAQQEQARKNIDADQSTYIISVTKDTDGNYSFTGSHATLKDVALMSKTGRRCILVVDTAENMKLTYTLAKVLWETGGHNARYADFVASYPDNSGPAMDVITWDAQDNTLIHSNIVIPIGSMEAFMQSAIVPSMARRGSYNYWYIDGEGGSIWYNQIVDFPAHYPVLYVQDKYGNLPLYLSEITDEAVLYKNIASDGSWVGFKVSASGSAPSQSGLISGSGSGGNISLGLSGVAAGQLLRVKAVNDNGNPTAWEVVNVSAAVSSTSTDNELATAKAVYDAITSAIGNIDTLVGTGEVTT